MITTTCNLLLVLLLEVAALPAGLTLHVETPSTGPYYPDLPVLLSVTLTNTSDSDAVIPALSLSSRENPYNTLDLFVASDDNPLQRVNYTVPNFSPWKEGISPQLPEMVTLAAGESWYRNLVLSHDWKVEPLESLVRGDTLHIQALFCGMGDVDDVENVIDRNDGLSSAMLSLPIAPLNAQDANALAKLRKLDRPWLVSHPAAVAHVPQGKDFRGFQDLARMPGNSPYSRYAQMVVAYMLAQGNELDLRGGRPPQPQVARLWVQKAMKSAGPADMHPEWIALTDELNQLIVDPDSNVTEEDESL